MYFFSNISHCVFLISIFPFHCLSFLSKSYVSFVPFICSLLSFFVDPSVSLSSYIPLVYFLFVVLVSQTLIVSQLFFYNRSCSSVLSRLFVSVSFFLIRSFLLTNLLIVCSQFFFLAHYSLSIVLLNY